MNKHVLCTKPFIFPRDLVTLLLTNQPVLSVSKSIYHQSKYLKNMLTLIISSFVITPLTL